MKNAQMIYSISHSKSENMATKHCEHNMLGVSYMHISTQYDSINMMYSFLVTKYLCNMIK